MLSTPSSCQSPINQSGSAKFVTIEYVQLHEDPNPHLEVRCIVRNALTGEDIRHAVAEFWLEGKDVLNDQRCFWGARLVDDITGQPAEDEIDQINGISLTLATLQPLSLVLMRFRENGQTRSKTRLHVWVPIERTVRQLSHSRNW